MLLTRKRKKEIKIVEIIENFLKAFLKFEEIYKKYLQGKIKFYDIEKFIDNKEGNLLFDLKESSHFLFRYSDKSYIKERERLFDLVMGSIFHEAMKFRENFYQITAYRPKYVKFKKRKGISPYERSLIDQFRKIINRAQKGMDEGIKETRQLFIDAKSQLEELLTEYWRNDLLVRFLLENKRLFQKVYGNKKHEEMLLKICGDGWSEVYNRVAMSYLKGKYFQFAAKYFGKAKKINPENISYAFFFYFSSAMRSYYENRYYSSLVLFKKMTRFYEDRFFPYLKQTIETLKKIEHEAKEEKNEKLARWSKNFLNSLEDLLTIKEKSLIKDSLSI